MSFSKPFIFGVATSAYQIEGCTHGGGRTDSIWDTFCRIPGRVFNGDNGDVACDHYNRFLDDIGIIKDLGVDAYRFSIAWPRIYPAEGVYNPEGMAYYKALLSALHDNGIKASVTLYHWDLPQWVQDLGGWEDRKSVEHFMVFAKKCFDELDPYVFQWITHNEPWCASILSNGIGEHAPGKRSLDAALKVAHHLLLSHGKTVQLYRESGFKQTIGITLNLTPVYAESDSIEDKLAESNMDGYFNRWFLDPLYKGQYPKDMLNLYAPRLSSLSFIQKGDLECIQSPCDFLGVNYYSRSLVKYDGFSVGLFGSAYSDYPKTAMGWDISPDAFVSLIERIRRDYTESPIYITENGSAWNDVLIDGAVHDQDRINYLEAHLLAVRTMNEKELNIAGYYCWSLMDNFEWSFGYSKRFGIVYVDFETQARIKKDSYYRYQQIISER